MCSDIAFLVNPFDKNDIVVGGFMRKHAEIRQANGLPTDWGYEGEWSSYCSKPTVRTYDDKYWHPIKRYIYGALGRKNPLSEEEIVNHMVYEFGSFGGFEEWAVKNGGIKNQVIQLYPLRSNYNWDAAGDYSIQHGDARVLLAGMNCLQRHTYSVHEYRTTPLAIAGSFSVQIIPLGGIGICGAFSFQNIDRNIDPEVLKRSPYVETRLVGKRMTTQEGRYTHDSVCGRRITCTRNGRFMIEEMNKYEIEGTVMEAISIIEEEDKNTMSAAIRYSFMQIPNEILNLLKTG